MTGADIARRRRAIGMTQVQFARALSISRRTLENWEGRATPLKMPGVLEIAIRHLEYAHAHPDAVYEMARDAADLAAHPLPEPTGHESAL